MKPLIETPEQRIERLERIISSKDSTGRFKRWAKRELARTRTEQLRQECAIPVKLQSKETA